MTDMSIEVCGETMTLLPERALFWPREAALLIADPHWGKDAAFRAARIAIPGGVLVDDLARLERALTRVSVRRLIILGDLLHAKTGRDREVIETVTAWRARHAAVEMLLVRGNHDRGAGDPPDEWGIQCVDEPHLLPPFVLLHHPQEVESGYGLAGHLHPAARLTGAGQSLLLPCFWFGARVGVLPAFGGFTGASPIRPSGRDRVFVVADDNVIAVR